MVKTHGLTHLSLAVSNVDRAFEFYRAVFGMEEVYREDGFIQAQTPGTWDVLVFTASDDSPKRSGDVSHFGFRLIRPTDIDDAAAMIEEAGGVIQSRGEFAPGEPYVFFTDLDGYEVEVWYERPTRLDPPDQVG